MSVLPAVFSGMGSLKSLNDRVYTTNLKSVTFFYFFKFCLQSEIRSAFRWHLCFRVETDFSCFTLLYSAFSVMLESVCFVCLRKKVTEKIRREVFFLFLFFSFFLYFCFPFVIFINILLTCKL